MGGGGRWIVLNLLFIDVAISGGQFGGAGVQIIARNVSTLEASLKRIRISELATRATLLLTFF